MRFAAIIYFIFNLKGINGWNGNGKNCSNSYSQLMAHSTSSCVSSDCNHRNNNFRIRQSDSHLFNGWCCYRYHYQHYYNVYPEICTLSIIAFVCIVYINDFSSITLTIFNDQEFMASNIILDNSW